MRLGFAAAEPITMTLALSGLVVLVETLGRTDAVAAGELAALGIPTRHDTDTLRFDVADLAKLSRAPAHVTFRPDEALAPLIDLTTHPSDRGVPADVRLDPDGVHVSWQSGGAAFDRRLPDEAAAALLCTDIPFVAAPAAFDHLADVCPLPLLAGRVAVNLDGFLEVSTSKPQLVESAPLPGLFRLDDGRYGVPLPYADQLRTLPGFQWTTLPPTVEAAPDVDGRLPMPLSSHARDDLTQLVTHLATWRAQAVVWSGGLGRRVFTCAALNVLDAWPALVVCRPEDVWTWTRHGQLLGRTVGVADPGADVQLLTYAQLAEAGGWPRAVQAVVFDSPQAAVGDAAVAGAARRLGSLADAYRLIVASTWPQAPAEQAALMSLLRPAEFDPEMPLLLRYPPDCDARFTEHVDAYLSRRDDAAGDDSGWFRRSKVLALPATPAQADAFERALGRLGADPAVTVMTLMELTSAGPEYATSPKVAAAVGELQAGLDAGERVIVATRFTRTAHLVHAMLRGRGVDLALTSEEAHTIRGRNRGLVARLDRGWGDLTGFDRVIVVDWPWSFTTIDDAVGSAAGTVGPHLVEVLHTPGSIDDKLVLLAARRGGDDGTLSGAETAWLLGRPDQAW